jgi:DNA-binding HxlR family transcriptional regulator
MRSTATAHEAPAESRCPIHKFQSLVSGKYKLRIVWDLREGPLRYNEIRRGLLRGGVGAPEIAARVLSRELKTLADMGVIRRIDYQQVPPKVEYELTTRGASLVPVIAAIHDWSIDNLTVELAAPSAIRRDAAARV